MVGICSHYLTPSSPFTFRSLRVNPGVPELPWELFWFGSSLNTLIIDKHSSKFPMSRERPAPTVTLTCGYGRVCWRGVALMGQTEREWDPEWGWQGSQNLFSFHHWANINQSEHENTSFRELFFCYPISTKGKLVVEFLVQTSLILLSHLLFVQIKLF